MIAILDPALFFTSTPDGPPGPQDQQELLRIFEGAISVMKETGATLPGEDWYWGQLAREWIGPLSRRLAQAGGGRSRLQHALETLLNYRKTTGLPERPTRGVSKLWGVKPLFEHWRWLPSPWQTRLPTDWLQRMERVLIGAVQKDRCLLIVRLVEGRNLSLHRDRKCELREKDPWRCYAHVPGCDPCHVPCVTSARNIRISWTTRYDERLPEAGRFPFCPPSRWWRRRDQGKELQALRTLRSKPCWIDRFGNGWTQPVTGGEYHWDVFLEDVQKKEDTGLDAINVVAWGTTETGKIPGDLHHIPKDKEGRLKPGAGWSCPA